MTGPQPTDSGEARPAWCTCQRRDALGPYVPCHLHDVPRTLADEPAPVSETPRTALQRLMDWIDPYVDGYHSSCDLDKGYDYAECSCGLDDVLANARAALSTSDAGPDPDGDWPSYKRGWDDAMKERAASDEPAPVSETPRTEPRMSVQQIARNIVDEFPGIIPERRHLLRSEIASALAIEREAASDAGSAALPASAHSGQTSQPLTAQ